MSAIREAERETKVWHRRRHNMLVLCLQEGLLSHNRITAFLEYRRDCASVAAKVGAGDPHVPMHEVSAEQKALKASAQNLLVVATLIYDDEQNARRTKMLVHLYSDWDLWFKAQNQTLRSTGEAPHWVYNQIDGRFNKTVGVMFQKLACAEVAFFEAQPGVSSGLQAGPAPPPPPSSLDSLDAAM